MEIHKRLNAILIIVVIVFSSCDTFNANSNKTRTSEQSVIEQRKQTQYATELLKDWFDDFVEIQEQLYSINTDEIILLEYGPNEVRKGTNYDKDKLITKINKIKKLIDLRESQLRKSNIEVSGLYRMIANFRAEVEKKEMIIESLRRENFEIKKQNQELTTELVGKTNKVLSLENELQIKDIELGRKYLFLFSKNETRLTEVNEQYFRLDYKIKDIEVLSIHPSSSYNLTKKRNYTLFNIYNDDRFWQQSKFLLVRINKKNL